MSENLTDEEVQRLRKSLADGVKKLFNCSVRKQDEKLKERRRFELEQIHQILDERDNLKKENSRLREALAVYADPEYWRSTRGDDQEFLFHLDEWGYVQGKRARAALEGKE